MFKTFAASFLASAVVVLAACGPSELAATQPARTAVVTTTDAPEPGATPQPSTTPTETVLQLEIVEWYEHANPNLADPTITDTTIEVLVHNPNDFPVTVITDEMEFRLLNAAGTVVYTNASAYFSLWEGSWMTPGDSTGFQICACFQSSGLETQDWVSIELVAPVERATDLAYTTDIEATLSESFSLFGGSGTGIRITMTNTSDQSLASIPMRVIARDANGRYIGMVGFGNSVVSFTEDISIPPGESLYGILDSEVDFFDGPLTYEVVAIGIIAVATPTPGAPEGTPSANWQGIPIMPGATNGGEAEDGYRFSTQATVNEITQFYEAALAGLGYSLTTSGEQSGITFLFFENGPSQAVVAIMTAGEANLVQLAVTP